LCCSWYEGRGTVGREGEGRERGGGGREGERGRKKRERGRERGGGERGIIYPALIGCILVLQGY
jgi:hypothetical protein